MAFCSRCGAQIPDGATFCTQCGQPLIPVTQNQAYYPTPAPQPAPAPKRKKKSALGIILILAILAVGGYFLYDYFGPFGEDPNDNRDWSGTEPRESVLPDGNDDSGMTNKEYRDWLLGD